MAVWFFLEVTWVCLRFLIVVFPDHTHLLFFTDRGSYYTYIETYFSDIYEQVVSSLMRTVTELYDYYTIADAQKFQNG